MSCGRSAAATQAAVPTVLRPAAAVLAFEVDEDSTSLADYYKSLTFMQIDIDLDPEQSMKTYWYSLWHLCCAYRALTLMKQNCLSYLDAETRVLCQRPSS